MLEVLDNYPLPTWLELLTRRFFEFYSNAKAQLIARPLDLNVAFARKDDVLDDS